MVVSIHQPDYISYLGYFYKMNKSDVFVFLDDCQFSNNNMHHWNRIKTPAGELRLKIPVEQHLGDLIRDVRTRDELGWKEKHLKTIKMNYSRAKYFGDFFPVFKELLTADYGNIAALNTAVNTEIARRFGIGAKLITSSELGIEATGEKRVINIVKALGGNEYISGHGAKAYQVDEHFESEGIKLVYTDYSPIEYRQQWPKAGFLPYMSTIDYIFNCGFDFDYVERAVAGKLKESD